MKKNLKNTCTRKNSFDVLIIIYFKFKLRSLRSQIFRHSLLFFEIDIKFEIDIDFVD